MTVPGSVTNKVKKSLRDSQIGNFLHDLWISFHLGFQQVWIFAMAFFSIQEYVVKHFPLPVAFGQSVSSQQ